ncbi:MAG: ArsA-related P-loop ATPase [Thermoplasmata archaeon]
MIYSFLGKGGVGKSTISTAFALEKSDQRKEKIALITFDFMPSLHHILKDGHENVDIYEYSEATVANNWIEEYGEEVYDLISSFFDLDRSIIDHIARAPGIAEEFMLSEILAMKSKYRTIVWDTAAASSTMHLLLAEKEFYDHISRDIKFYVSIKNMLNKINRHGKDPITILNKWQLLAKNVWEILEKETVFFVIENQDELSKIQAMEIEEDLKNMGLSIKAHILNRCISCEGTISIPELKGSALETVQKIRFYIKDSMKVYI